MEPQTQVSQVCPECGCERIEKAGLRYLADNSTIQRYKCRKCRHRFSENSKNNSYANNEVLMGVLSINRSIQIGATNKEAKNLEPQTELKTFVGEENTTQHGLIVEFQWKMKKRQLADATITNRTVWLSELVKLGANLKNPDSVETVLATEKISPPTKLNMVKTYAAFTRAFKIEWEKVKVRYDAKEAFDPLEEEIDQLIAGCGKVTSAFLQTLKDTGARAGEIRQLEWTDINDKNGTIAINHPGKGSRTRTVKVTAKTIAMLKNLPKKNGDYVFNPKRLSVRFCIWLHTKKNCRENAEPKTLKNSFPHA